ncbi:plasmid partition protein ParF [Salmonella enterica subsp. arizonae]|uniref:Plasmid partition protein ParF n=1 Tax=Salmonella enterica subsp. arizonae TaxID=59203 RepID=A0A379SM64_SALER|nr:plasmid partition protein ParF [Salmonella enterica subsp. arizonae]
MKVISFLNPKGGSGKTTAVINVSTAMARAGYNIAVVDTDPQMSLTTWSKSGKAAFDVFTAASEKDVYGIRKDLTEYDFVIVDGAGSLSVITSAAVMVSDLVIIPVTPSRLIFLQQEALSLSLKRRHIAGKLKLVFSLPEKSNRQPCLVF